MRSWACFEQDENGKSKRNFSFDDIQAEMFPGLKKHVKVGRNEPCPCGSGKTEAAKHIARLLNRTLFYVDFDCLIDSKLGQTTKNIANVFAEINQIPFSEKVVILFDEIDVIALDRVNNNDVREMGRATSMILRELDRMTDLNKEIVIVATTNLFENFDKALVRRFDAVINFNRYDKLELIEVAEAFFASFIKHFKGITKDTRLFKKILNTTHTLPYPGELKNIVGI